MIGVLIDGEFLDLLPSTSITIRRRHNLFDGSDPTVLRGSYTLPFTVPLTDHNKDLLNNPHRVDNLKGLLAGKEAYLYISNNQNYGVPYLAGELIVTDANDATAEISLATTSMSEITQTMLKELELGSTTQTDMRAHALATAVNPMSQPECFFPVRNPNFYDQDILDSDLGGSVRLTLTTQNYFDNASGTFGHDGKYHIVTPFLRYTWLLQQVFAHHNYTLYNSVEDDSELRLLYLLHTHNIHSADIWPDDINYVDCVPNVACDHFYKQYTKMLFLGVFADPTRRTVEFIKWSDVLTAGVAQDWSGKRRTTYSNRAIDQRPARIGYQADSYEELPDEMWVSKYGYTLSEDYLYVFSTDTYYGPPTATGPRGARSTRTTYDRWSRITIGGSASDLLWDIYPLRTILGTNGRNAHDQDASIYSDDDGYPIWHQPGSYRKYTYNDAGDAIDTDDTVVTEFDIDHASEDISNELNYLAVTLYRGIKQGRPYANSIGHNPDDIDAPLTYSLALDGDNGLANTLGAEALHFLRTHKQVQMPLDLDINDLLTLKEYDKVRIDNMVYLVKEIEITIGVSGVQGPASVTLCTVV